MKIKNSVITSVSGIILYGSGLYAQSSTSTGTTAPEAFTSTYYDVVALLILLVAALIIGGFLFFGMGEGAEKPSVEKEPLWSRIKNIMTRSAPIEKEHEILMQDDYDGIKELDNRIPPWFSWLFYATIVFACYYLLNYHVFGSGKLQEEEYADEVRIASLQREELIKSGAFVNEETVTLAYDPESINEGKNIFKANCIPCHGPEAGGVVGPNLTDDYWIHGGGIKNIFKTIKYGVPAKGMISWQTQLNPKQIQEVASFVISLKGTKPSVAKAPEGVKYVEVDSTNIKKM